MWTNLSHREKRRAKIYPTPCGGVEANSRGSGPGAVACGCGMLLFTSISLFFVCSFSRSRCYPVFVLCCDYARCFRPSEEVLLLRFLHRLHLEVVACRISPRDCRAGRRARAAVSRKQRPRSTSPELCHPLPARPGLHTIRRWSAAPRRISGTNRLDPIRPLSLCPSPT
jgi:hypothetical protein